jgi:hypothetical protein
MAYSNTLRIVLCDRLLGNDEAIHAARDRKLAEARERRKEVRQARHEQLEPRSDSSRPANPEQRRGTRSHWFKHLYNPT